MGKSTDQSAVKRGGCRGCLGCLGKSALVILILVGGLFLLQWGLGATGLLRPTAERQLDGAPDRAAGALIDAALAQEGVTGVRATVLPVRGSDGQLAVITLDPSQAREDDGRSDEVDGFDAIVRGLAAANDNGANIERAVLDIRGETGEPFMTLTAPQEAIEAYADGRIDHREFARSVDADIGSLLDLIDMETLQAASRGE